MNYEGEKHDVFVKCYTSSDKFENVIFNIKVKSQRASLVELNVKYEVFTSTISKGKRKATDRQTNR